MSRNKSRALFAQAARCMVGGVNSPVRAYKAVGGTPVFIRSARGSGIVDADRNRYVDYVMSWGAMILGHAHPGIVRAIQQAAESGTSFGAPTAQETALCRALSRAVPSMQKIRLVNSGTEATMSALRLSRGFTGKNRIVKFEGCYHGHSDSLLVKAGSGALTLGVPDSAGVPACVSRDTIVCPYNDSDALARVIKARHKEIACVIVEPVAANMGLILPDVSFLSAVRELTARYRIVLIFDEVITGFRFTFGGVQQLFGIAPDLTCLGKIIGGGLPLAAYGGSAEIMDRLAPLGPVYQAGTLSGNPVAVSAGLAALAALEKADYVRLNETTADLCDGMEAILRMFNLHFCLNRAGSVFTLFFTQRPVRDFVTAKTSDPKAYARFFWTMLEEGIHLPPSQFEGNFLSFAHTPADIQRTLKAFSKAVAPFAKSRCRCRG
ncbi:MAG TPA: glutamate-1-semialdehyde 2,1-aminomutase [Candidatus Omnitrophota bacterium]|nr:glutamate-1-semialdehyde 2,1-aminomutase [Candidatus Omnitrophota bacterium]